MGPSPMDFLRGISDDDGDDAAVGAPLARAATAEAPAVQDFLEGVSDDDGHDDGHDQLAPFVLGGAIVAAPAAPAAKAGLYGRGRHGTALERRAVASRAREGKAQKRTERLRVHLASSIAKTLGSRKLVKGTIQKVKFRVSRAARSMGIRLHTRSSSTGGNRKPQWMSHTDVLDLAFGENSKFRRSHLASIFLVSSKWVGALQVLAADTYLHFQRHSLGRLVMLCDRHPPKFAISRTAWDETGEKLTLDVPNANANLQRSCWQIMVAKLRLVVGFGPDLQNAVVDFKFVIPPIAITTPSADEIFNSLCFHEHVRPLLEGRSMIFAKAKYALDLSETDAAASNERLEAHFLNAGRRGVWKAHFFCRLHQTQLCETLLLSLCNFKLLSRLYSLTTLLQTSGYFLRLALALPKYLASPSGLIRKPYASFGMPPPAALGYSTELQAYMKAHWRRFQRSQERDKRAPPTVDPDADSEDDDASATIDRGRREYFSDLQAFFNFFNGRLWEPECVHHCAGAHCCVSHRDAVAKGASLAHRVLFRASPSTPAANKWSKLGPVLDWVLLNTLCHSLLLSLMLSLQVATPAADVREDDDDMDELLQQELNFAALKGKRWQACTSFFMNTDHVTTMVFLALTLEPLRGLTAWWMRTAVARQSNVKWIQCSGPLGCQNFDVATCQTEGATCVHIVNRPLHCRSPQERARPS